MPIALKFDSNANQAARAITTDDYDYTIAAESRKEIVEEGTSTSQTDQDVNYNENSPATVDEEWDVSIQDETPGTFYGGFAYSSSDTDIATIDDDGKVERVSDGSVDITVNTGRLTKVKTLTVQRSTGSTINVFDSYVDNTIGKKMSSVIDDNIAGKTKATHGQIFSTLNLNQNATRDANCWANIADLSCISINRPNTLAVTQGYGIQAEHYKRNDAIFVDMDNNHFYRRITNRVNIAGTDMSIVQFDADLPSSILPALVPPANFDSYLPTASTWKRVPTLRIDQVKQALVGNISSISNVASNPTISHRKPFDATRQSFYEKLVSGDSGNNAFLMLPGSFGDYTHRLVVLNHWYTGNGGSGDAPFGNISDINSAISSMGGTQELTTADLSDYTSF